MRTRVLLPVLVAGLLAFTGCTPAQTAGQEGSGATPTESATSEVMPARISITSTELQLFGPDDEPLSNFTYFDNAEAVVAALTELFGDAPVVTSQPGDGLHQFPASVYTWGGFTLYDSEQEVREPTSENFSVHATTAAVNGVIVATVDGIQVGSSATQIAGSHPDAEQRWVDNGTDMQFFSVDETRLGIVLDGGDELVASVQASSDHPDGVIASLAAPYCELCGP